MMTQDEQWLLKEKYHGEKTEGFFTDCERLKANEPLAYIIGHSPFLDTVIYLDSAPLIPRTETEYWTELAINEIKKHPSPKVLDLCAGSGAIGTAVAKAVPKSIVHFAEIDPVHLPTISKNLETNNIPCTRYRVWQSDLFSELSNTLATSKQTHSDNCAKHDCDDETSMLPLFDFILTNPPYIDPVLDRTEYSVKTHEPHLALYGGVHGMEVIGKIIEQATAYLQPHGQLWIEHEPEQSGEIIALANKNNYVATTHTDQYDVKRYTVLVIQ